MLSEKIIILLAALEVVVFREKNYASLNKFVNVHPPLSLINIQVSEKVRPTFLQDFNQGYQLQLEPDQLSLFCRTLKIKVTGLELNKTSIEYEFINCVILKVE